MVALSSRPSRSKTLLFSCQAALLVLAAVPLAPAADAGLVLCPGTLHAYLSQATATSAGVPPVGLDDLVAYVAHQAAQAGSSQTQASSDCSGSGDPGQYPTPTTSSCPYPEEGLVVSWLGVTNSLCVETPPGTLACVHDQVSVGDDNQLCVEYPPGGIVCASDYVNGALLVDRTCVDYIASGKPCVSHYVDQPAQLRDRTCLDDDPHGYACVSNYWADGSLNARLCPGDRDDANHLCPTAYESGHRLDRACADQDDRGFTCASDYSDDASVQARACLDDDGQPSHPCATTYVDGFRQDRACYEPSPDGRHTCASNTVDAAVGQLTGCLDQSDDGQPGHACGALLLNGGELDRACNDPDPSMVLCGSDYVLGAAAAERACVGSYPEGLCASDAATVLGVAVEDRVCSTTDEAGNPCAANTVYLGGSPLAEDRTCHDATYDEGSPCAAHRVTVLGRSAEARTCSHTNPQTGEPCQRTVVFVDGNPQQTLDPCVPTVAPCDGSQVGVVVDGQPSCVPHPCPVPTESPGPGQVAVVCGHPVNDPCPGGVNTNTVAACGQGPVCPDGVTSPPGPNELAVVCEHAVPNPCPEPVGAPASQDLAVVCGVHVPNPCPAGVDPTTAKACGDPRCPTGVTSPPGPGQLAVVCGNAVPNPCPTPVGAPGPDDLAVVCGVAVKNPCKQGVDTAHAGACGLPPACPTGVTSPPGAGEAAVVCDKHVPNPCVGPTDLNTVTVCGQGPVCRAGVTSPPGPNELAVVCGQPVWNPCPTPVGTPGPGQLAVVCGQPVPCAAGVDPMTGAACVAGPVCPDGVFDPAQPDTVCGNTVPTVCTEPVGPRGPGQLAVVCGQPVPNPLPGHVPACMDGEDNDGDGHADYWPSLPGFDDPDCVTPFDDSESA